MIKAHKLLYQKSRIFPIISVFGGVIFTVVLLFCMVPVEVLRSRLKKRHRELTEPLGLYNSQHNLSPYQQQQQYEMYQQQQNEMLR